MRIVFICWGNICRSPAAEATFRKLVENEHLTDQITIDSAEAGEHPDAMDVLDDVPNQWPLF